MWTIACILHHILCGQVNLRTIQPLTDISIISASCKPVAHVMEFEVGSLMVEM